MTLPLGSQTALVGLDTGCARCVVSQQFLDRFILPEGSKRPCMADIDNGSSAPLHTTEIVTLPIQIGSHFMRTDWIVVPRLAAPLDALISWSWMSKMKIVLDCDANFITFKQPPSSAFLVPSTFNQSLQSQRHPHQALTAPI